MSRGGFRGRGRGGGGMMDGRIPAFNAREFAEALQNPNKHGGMLYPPLDTKNIAYLPAPDSTEEQIIQHALDMEEILSNGLPGVGAPWRLATERKVVGIEIESYSDRFKPPVSAAVTKLDPVALRMDEDLFPPGLWKAYFEGEEVVKPKNTKKRKLLAEGDEDGNDEEGDKSSQSSVDDDFDFDDDDSDHQDYDANYFDNGEGDDDSGGEEEEGGGGADD